MANNKVGLDYFELDCQLEDRIRLIQAEFGLKGFAVVVKLYQKIYGGFGYYCEWSEDSLLLFMSDNGIPGDSRKLIQEIVQACIRRNIFSERLFHKFSILTSHGVQKRYMNATSRREKVSMKKEYLLLSDGEINSNVNIIADSVCIIPDNADRIAQRREEESREEERRGKSTFCTEPEKPPSVPPVISLPLNDKTFHDISGSDVEAWKELYPAVDILKELRKMKGWLDSNPAKRKTGRGIRRFINGWLAREQDKPHGAAGQGRNGVEAFLNG